MVHPQMGIINYGMGNLKSIVNAFEAIGVPAFVVSNPMDLIKADAIVLPGVDAFGDGFSNLRCANFFDALNENILEKKKLW